MIFLQALEFFKYSQFNSGEFEARSDGAKPISNGQALSDNVTNFLSIDDKIS
ncbi:MAG: hypothetical protein LN561_02210 [Rickettsia endosymbiont of Labidopullus appendiculatus]|nr:hypothetical protein [Rickettsia endosymbiont of Labidopullus appendiculatus]